MATRAKQLEFVIRQHGGRRAGAGRKAAGRRNVMHRVRPRHDARVPVHVTLRTTALPASLRAPAVFAVVRVALARASRTAFRVVAFSVQRNHVHLVVEADVTIELVRGLQGLAIRVAKSVNRVLGRRGSVWGDRYHARELATPREVRNAFRYVFQNHRKHGQGRGQRFDPCSSAAWWDGWKHWLQTACSSPVVTARTWLARWDGGVTGYSTRWSARQACRASRRREPGAVGLTGHVTTGATGARKDRRD
jgi:hypothetical protein